MNKPVTLYADLAALAVVSFLAMNWVYDYVLVFQSDTNDCFFLFGEELFLAMQLSERGFKVYFEPSITVTHASHVAVGKMPTRRHWELMRQSHRIYRKHKPI